MRKLLMIGLAVLLLAPAVSEAQNRSHFCPQFDNQFDLGGTQCQGRRWRDLALAGDFTVGDDATIRGDLSVAGAFTLTGSFSPTAGILAAAGTVGTPGYSFASDPTTGIYYPSANKIAFSLGGVYAGQFAVNAAFTNSRGLQVGGIDIGSNADLYLLREAAGVVQIGADAATAAAQTVTAGDSTDAGKAGASLTLSGGSGGAVGAQGEVIVAAGSTFRADNFAIPLVADATVQFGQTVMPDASADGRFDVTTGSATLSIGVLGGVGPSAAASTYPVITSGLAYVAQNEDVAVTRGHFLIQSATAGYCDDSATVTTIGLNIAKALYSEAVSAVIDNAGCTGSAGCINTALNTPNTGPAGQITLGVDVAALGWAAGQPVIFWNSGGTDPTGLTDGKVYFLASVATTNVTISATYGGAVVVPSDQGDDPTQYLARLPRSVLSIQ